jgi:hypothetical protein
MTELTWVASELTKEKWHYLKVPQKEFEQLHPEEFEELVAGINPPSPTDY